MSPVAVVDGEQAGASGGCSPPVSPGTTDFTEPLAPPTQQAHPIFGVLSSHLHRPLAAAPGAGSTPSQAVEVGRSGDVRHAPPSLPVLRTAGPGTAGERVYATAMVVAGWPGRRR